MNPFAGGIPAIYVNAAPFVHGGEKIGHAIDCDMCRVMTPTESCSCKDSKLLQPLGRGRGQSPL